MMLIDVSALLQPVRTEAPCGPNLEYSPLYLDAARALEGSPDVQYGSMHLAAVEPDWKRVKRAALDLFEQSRDLRVAVWLTRALVALHGVIGVADGFALIEGLLTRYWEGLHPRLDAEEDFDPMVRINTLLALDDATGFVREIGEAALVDSPHHGRISLRDVDMARAEASAEGGAFDPALIEQAFAEAAPEDLVAAREALSSALRSLARIDACLTEYIGHRRTVPFTALRQVLGRASQMLDKQCARHPAFAVREPAALELSVANPADIHHARGGVAGREDVLRMLDQLCGYYALAEPSSPVPVLLQRARTLVGKRFVDLVSELAPAGLEQATHWVGTTRE